MKKTDAADQPTDAETIQHYLDQTGNRPHCWNDAQVPLKRALDDSPHEIRIALQVHAART